MNTNLIKALGKSASTEKARYALTGLYINGRTLATTDGYRLAVAQLDFDPQLDKAVIADGCVFKDLPNGELKAIRLHEDADATYLEFEVMQTNKTVFRLTVGIIEENYPPFNKIIPSPDNLELNYHTVSVNADYLKNALEQLAIFAKEVPDRRVKLYVPKVGKEAFMLTTEGLDTIVMPLSN